MTVPFCTFSAFPQFCRLLRTCPLFWLYERGATGCSRGALLEVNNLYPLQEPAWASTGVIVTDTQLLQLTQVNGFDGENIHLQRRQEANDCVSQKGVNKGSKWPRVTLLPHWNKVFAIHLPLCSLGGGTKITTEHALPLMFMPGSYKKVKAMELHNPSLLSLAHPHFSFLLI